MDGARPGSVEIALTKARSAARRLRPTAEEAGGDVMQAVRLALASGLNVTGIGGGSTDRDRRPGRGWESASVRVRPTTTRKIGQAGIDALLNG